MKRCVLILLSVFFTVSLVVLGISCKPAAEESAIEEPAAEESAIEEPAAEESAIEEELPIIIWGIDSFLNSLPQLAARELGYFAEEGVNIQFRVNSMGVDTMDQIIGQDVDLGTGAHWALVNRMTQPNLGLGGVMCDWGVPTELMVSEEIENLSDLKGKTIAVIQGSVWDYFLARTLEAAGLTEDDITLSNFSAPIDYLGAGIRGDINAGWFYATDLIKAKEALEPLGWHSVATAEDIAPDVLKGWVPLPISIKTATKNPVAIAGAIKAYKRGMDWINENPKEAAELASKLMGLSVEDAANLIPSYHFNVGFPKETVELMEKMKEYALQKGYIAPINDYNFDEKIIFEPMKIAFPELVDENLLK